MLDYYNIMINFGYEPGITSAKQNHHFLISKDGRELTLVGNEEFKAYFAREINELITFSPPQHLSPRLGYWDWLSNGETKKLILNLSGTLTCD